MLLLHHALFAPANGGRRGLGFVETFLQFPGIAFRRRCLSAECGVSAELERLAKYFVLYTRIPHLEGGKC
jgi:hypothetical protein